MKINSKWGRCSEGLFFHRKFRAKERILGTGIHLFVWVGLFLLWMGNSPVWGKSFGVADLDVLVTAPEGFSNRSHVSAGGDFNGDGFDDVAVLEDYFGLDFPIGPQTIQLILGSPDFPQKSDLQSLVKMKIHLPTETFGSGDLFFADINGDGKDDLFFCGFGSPSSKLLAVFGTTTPPVSLDWGMDLADLELTVNSALYFSAKSGDFNGDGKDDLLVGMNTNAGGDVYLVLGQSVFTSSSFVVNSANSALWVHKSGDGLLGQTIASGDVDGDGKSDMVLSAPRQDGLGWRTLSGEIYVIRGSTEYITPWNLDSTPADITITGGNGGAYFQCPAMGDFNGDGKSDLVVIDSQERKGFLLDGLVLSDGLSRVDMQTGIPGYSPPAFGGLPPFTIWGISTVTGDFDGNGMADLFPSFNDQVHGLLSSNIFGSPIVAPASFGFLVPFDASLGDVNGDDKQDLVVLPLGGPNGSVGIIYGYEPLDNPTIQVRGNPFLPKVILDLRVEGDPTEMKISGDFDGPEKDRWIPFQPSLPMTLTKIEGDKTLKVIFRNKFARESLEAQASVTLNSGSQGLVVVNNVIDSHTGTARVDCHVDASVLVKATIHDQSGVPIAGVMDRDLPAGVWPLEWDGKNESGRSVGPGIYYMAIERNGTVEKRKILVQR